MTEPKPKTLQEALVAALAKMPNPTKNAENPAFKREGKPMRYADLEATLDACKPVLAEHGIALVQMPANGESGEIGVHTVLLGHGEQMDCGTFFLPMEGNTPQKAAGAITYARRYALTAIFGLAQEDDDANAASQPSAAPKASAGKAASDKQINAIFALAKKVGWTEDHLSSSIAKSSEGKNHPGDLTSAEASKLIEYLGDKADELEKQAKAAEPAADEGAPV